MARTRNIKPGFFTNEELAECSFQARLLFAGLWTLADRDGRLEDRPKRIKSQVFPYDDADIESLLGELLSRGFVCRYTARGVNVLFITGFVKNQHPHPNEAASELAPMSEALVTLDANVSTADVNGIAARALSSLSSCSFHSLSSSDSEPDLVTTEKTGTKKAEPISVEDVSFPDGMDSPAVRDAMAEWLAYKRKRGQSYKDPASLAKLLKKFQDDHARDGPAMFIAAVNFSIAQNYAGCFPPGTSRKPKNEIGPGQRHDPKAELKW